MVRFLVLLLMAFSSVVAHGQDSGICEVNLPSSSDVTNIDGSLNLDAIRKISIDESEEDSSLVRVSFYREDGSADGDVEHPLTFEFDLSDLSHSKIVASDNSSDFGTLEVSSVDNILSSYGGYDSYKNYGLGSGSLELIGDNSASSKSGGGVQLLIGSTEILVSQGIVYSLVSNRIKLAPTVYASSGLATAGRAGLGAAIINTGKYPVAARGIGAVGVAKVATAVYLVLDGFARYGYVFSDNTGSPVSAIGDIVMNVVHMTKDN